MRKNMRLQVFPDKEEVCPCQPCARVPGGQWTVQHTCSIHWSPVATRAHDWACSDMSTNLPKIGVAAGQTALWLVLTWSR
jgi:hypothetical protein